MQSQRPTHTTHSFYTHTHTHTHIRTLITIITIIFIITSPLYLSLFLYVFLQSTLRYVYHHLSFSLVLFFFQFLVQRRRKNIRTYIKKKTKNLRASFVLLRTECKSACVDVYKYVRRLQHARNKKES